MRDDYKLVGSTTRLQMEVESTVAEALQKMESHTQLTISEMANTALKRYISAHKDFLPPAPKKSKD